MAAAAVSAAAASAAAVSAVGSSDGGVAVDEIEGVADALGMVRIPVVDAGVVSQEAVWARYVAPSLPCIWRGGMHDWPCSAAASRGGGSDSYTAEVAGGILRGLFGAAAQPTVPLERPPAGGEAAGYGAAVREQLPLEAALAAVARGDGYLKDWHVVRDAPAAASRALYRVPSPFADDYLNFYYDTVARVAGATAVDDYRFVYYGPRGSRTPVHHDVMYSASWSANVCGTKLWLMLPPEVSRDTLYDAWGDLCVNTLIPPPLAAALLRYLAPATGDHVPHNACAAAAVRWLTTVAAASPPAAVVPDAALHVAVQRAGDVMFVPPGWHHEVLNLATTLSVNHNWFCAASLGATWGFVAREAAAVRASIQDCRDTYASPLEWECHVQLLLRLNAAANADDLGTLLLLKGAHLLRLIAGDDAGSEPLPGSLDALPPSFEPYAAPYTRYPRTYCCAALSTIRRVAAALADDPYVVVKAAGRVEVPTRATAAVPPAAVVAELGRAVGAAGGLLPPAPVADPYAWTRDTLLGLVGDIDAALNGP